VRAVLKATPETARLNIKIIARGGRLELAGTVEPEPGPEAAARVAAAVPGVLAVDNHITVMKFPKW
jgi:osmotically-inducible protein OsmY